jgi:phage terminase large subunit GpA-like protein
LSKSRTWQTTWATAWQPRRRVAPSEWAERYRVLPLQGNAEPGRFRFARTPYMRGVVDAIQSEATDVVIIAGTQVGKTTALENLLGYWIDNDPGPALIVKPSETDVGEYIKERVRPLLESSLAQHICSGRDDNTLRSIKLDTMPLYFGWAGSPGSLASRPCRYVLLDECDKFPPFAGREADPISLARERLATYGHRARLVMTSTPTTRDGAIWKAWESCGDRRFYFVPCTHCGETQRLVWQQVKWPKLAIEDSIKRGDEIEQSRLAWYECVKCKGRIEESHKPKMLERGEWRNETGQTSPRVGFHLNSLYSPWRTFASMAAEFIRAENDSAATMNFRNSRLAEPFENVSSSTKPSLIRDKIASGAERNIVPDWAVALFTTVDTQKDWFKLHIRAWGPLYRSQLVLEAVCESFEEVYRIGLESVYVKDGGGKMQPHAMLIDSGGDRTNEVYQFALRDPGRIMPTKGASHAMRRPWMNAPQPNGVVLRYVDTSFYKDMLTRLIHEPDKWAVHEGVSEQYIVEMASEHKIIDRNTGKSRWLPKHSGARVEAWDCEVLQCVAADMAQLGSMPSAPPPDNDIQDPAPRRPDDGTNWFTSHKGRW